jgi:glycosyltransferase involved in cell wall biosynthesis
MIRVLHLTAGNLYGGVETLQLTLAKCRHLAPDMEPHFGLCFRGRLWDELAAVGAPLHDFGAVRVSRPWTVVRARRRLKEVLRRTGFDVVVSHSSWPHAIFGPVARRAGARLAYMVHGEVNPGHWLDRWASWARPSVVLPNSNFVAASAARLFRQSRLETMYYPIAAPAEMDTAVVRKEVREALGTPERAVVILQASRLERWKGQALHLEALGQLRALAGWEAWFAGGPQKAGEARFLAELHALAGRLGVADRVRFLGQRSDVPRLMAAADLFCQPNLGPEPFGIVFVEALYAGLPVVATAFGGAAEIVTEACGLLAAPGDAGGVAAELAGLIVDPVRRQALGVAGPARARELCDPAAQLARLSALLGKPADATGARAVA